jgi:hypothetical protein
MSNYNKKLYKYINKLIQYGGNNRHNRLSQYYKKGGSNNSEKIFFINEDLLIYNPELFGGSDSDDIIPIIQEKYINFNSKLGLIGKNNSQLKFIINLTQIGSKSKLLFAAGANTAIYQIKDAYSIINDSNVIDNIYNR